MGLQLLHRERQAFQAFRRLPELLSIRPLQIRVVPLFQEQHRQFPEQSLPFQELSPQLRAQFPHQAFPVNQVLRAHSPLREFPELPDQPEGFPEFPEQPPEYPELPQAKEASKVALVERRINPFRHQEPRSFPRSPW
jgi:hypothetical protein